MRILVTCFTKRYVVYEYAHCFHDDMYHMPPSDELFQQLFFTSNSEVSKTLSSSESDEIHIYVKAHFVPLIRSNTVGLRLHRYVKKEMCRDVELSLATQVEDKMAIRAALQLWLNERHIQDEEFSVETAIKTFFRFRQEKLKKVQRNVQKSCTPFVLTSRNILHYTKHQDFEQILRGYIAQNEAYFLTTRKKPHTRRIKQARCFIMRKIGLLTPEIISKKTSIPKRTVQHAVRKFDLFLKSKPNLLSPKP